MSTQNRFTRINGQIRVPSVRVKFNGEHLGVMPTNKALDMAWDNEMDLVEISPNTVPPICEIMDYNKFKFEEKKKKKEQLSKNKSAVSKDLKLRPVTGEHDVEIKINQLKKFLAEKHPVSVGIEFKKRELHFKDRAFEIMNKIVESVKEVGTTVSVPKFEGLNLVARFSPKSH